MKKVRNLFENMEPQKAAQEITIAAQKIFPLLSKEERRDLITRMFGTPGDDKVAGLVHL